MGLLDEAIRDHLDLKRKRGADPTQLAREEQEALGPAVRTAEPEAPAPAAEAAAPPVGEELPPPEAPAAAEAPPVDEPPAPAEAAPPAADETLVEPPPAADETLVEPPPPADETLPAEAESTPPAEPEAAEPGQETAPFDAEDLFADEDVEVEEPGPQPGEGQDVLEETPEFLQETPEHDRLWFEQKPPRDFDFDG
jgi:hypothetical protein